MKNLPIRAIAQLLGIPSENPTQVTGYQIDSREVRPGNLFFALEGKTTDGHHHLAEVKAKGAVAAVVSSSYNGPDFGLELLPVNDVLFSLQNLAKQSIEKEKSLQVVGVTGSVGKTTTKDFIATLLSGKYKTGKSERSFNTRITYPLTILNREEDLEVLVLELGMSKPGDIGKLLEIAAPDIALVTKIALAHAADFPGGLPDIARGKAEIFSHPKTKLAIFYQGFHDFEGIVEKINIPKVSFSLEDPKADYFLSPADEKYLLDERGVRAYRFDLPFHQPHILHNFLAAVCVARAMRLEWDEINQRIPFLQLPKMRFEQYEKEGIAFVNDAYNANPDSMKAALSNLPESKEGGKKIGVLGTMCDLGSFSESAHRDVGQFAQKYIDHLLVLGSEAAPLCESFQEVKKPAELFIHRNELAERLKELMRPGDVVLVKGSRAMKMETIFELLD